MNLFTTEINLNIIAKNSNRYRKFLILWLLLLGAVSAIIFLLLFLTVDYYFWLLSFWGLHIALFVYSLYASYNAKLYVKADDFAFSYRLGYYRRSSNSIVWKSVKSIKLGPTYIAFYKLSGKCKKIRLGWLPYKELIEVKNLVNFFAKLLEIETKYADIIKYQNEA